MSNDKLTILINERIKIHEDAFNHYVYLSQNYAEINWPGGGPKKSTQDYYAQMIRKEIIKELKQLIQEK